MSLFLARARGSVRVLLHAREVVREKEALLAENAELRYENQSLRILERENNEFRRLLGFQKRQGRKLVLCEVLSRGDSSGWWQIITLSRGSDSGIRNDMAVVTADGLVGRTQTVSRQSCDVLLITDPNCKVACRLVRGGAFGIVRGKGVSIMGDPKLEMLGHVQPLQMDYVPRDTVLKAGVFVETSGLGGVYPEGLSVGRVIGISRDRSGLYQRVALQPSAALGALKYVFVVVN
jgi:rod shape-determining protein MreC